MPSADLVAARAVTAWNEVGAFLSRELLLLGPEVRAGLRRDWLEIAEAEKTLDDRLAVGLVGGTGVGKSTLINALAGHTISTSGDRRPTTDRVIAYHHRATRLPEGLPRRDLTEPTVTHETAGLERVILLDFPDFDSIDALHHEILNRAFPHLDVLIIVVDDVKYADARLFELLRRLPQSHENLHAVLNKIDRLEKRYPGKWRAVADEILDDLAAKLEKHAGVAVPRAGLIAISAQNALLAKTSNAPSPIEVGDFDALVSFLDGYRQEKRRRAAKELNIEARKESLGSKLRGAALGRELEGRAIRSLEIVERRRNELERTLAGIPPAIFTRGERRTIANASLARSAGRFGFPVDLLLTIATRFRWRRSGEERLVELTASRVKEHYRAYFQGVENFRSEIALEAAEILPAASGGRPRSDFATGHPALFSDSGEELQRSLASREESLASRSHLWNHALPLLVVALYLWSMTYPALSAALHRVAGDEGASWGGALKELFFSALASLSPTAIAGFILTVALSYAAAALAAWGRHAQRLEQAITEAEDSLRARVRRQGAGELDEAARALARWRAERAELEELLGEP
jgi:GTP-binding protein EngB required for normal cell division